MTDPLPPSTPAPVVPAPVVSGVPDPIDPPTDKGFPEGVPVREMTSEQQVAYDKFMRAQNRERREAFDKATGGRNADQVRADYEELERLRREKLTPSEQAIAQATDKARREGETTAAEKFSVRLVASEFKAALAGRRKPDEIATIVGGIDPKKFLTESGEVDTDKVTQYAAGLAPAGTNGWPDMGQGNRGTGTSGKGVAVGAEMFAAKRGKTTTT